MNHEGNKTLQDSNKLNVKMLEINSYRVHALVFGAQYANYLRKEYLKTTKLAVDECAICRLNIQSFYVIKLIVVVRVAKQRIIVINITCFATPADV